MKNHINNIIWRFALGLILFITGLSTGIPANGATYSAYFRNDIGWSSVSTWIWDNGNGSKNYTGDIWPGALCSQKEVNGEMLWYYTFSTEDVLSMPMIIFNDNGLGDQTKDLEFVNNGLYDYNGFTGTVIEPASSNIVEVIPNPSTNLVGTDTGTAIQPLEKLNVTNSGVTFTFSTGSGSTAPAYYRSNSTIRVYNGNTFTLESTDVVAQVEFMFIANKNTASTLSANSGTVVYDAAAQSYTWTNTDNVTSVSFNVNDTQIRITSLRLLFGSSTENRPKAPVFSQNSCEFYKPFDLTITDINDPAATIRYTLDGSIPTADNGMTYSAPITIPIGNDVTVKAVSINENGTSSVTSASYHFIPKHLFSVKIPNKNGINYIYYSSNSEYGEWRDDNSTYITEGENLYIGLTFNTGYKCKGITLNGITQEMTGSSFEFVMPASDVEVVIDVEFNPSSPADPQPGDTTKKYNLYLACNPSGAASLNGSGTYTAGSNVYVYAYNQSGYVFTGWTKDGETISTSSSFDYTMPSSDVVLTANYIYNPSSPSDPQQPTLKHPLTVIASPAGAGTFSISSSEVTFGEEYYVYAYPQTGYKFKGWIVNGVAQEGTSTQYTGVMTDAGAQIVGLFTFDPTSPSNPGANYYNSTTGQVIIDDFTPGNLYSALSNVVGSSNYENVSSLIVKGRMSSNDYGTLSYLTNAVTIDLSRVGGVTTVPGYAFQKLAAGNILLSSAITSIGNYAFSNCANLTALTVYAQEPPTCSYSTFSGFTNKDNCTVFVPESAIELYVAADYWKDFTILPITDDAHVLQVNLPADASDGRYKSNSIELVNLNSGIRQKYVVSDRLLYTFNGLRKDEQYNIYMLSQAGLELGRIENVTVPDNDFEVTFDNLKSVYSVNAVVTTPDGKDVTSDVTVEWLKPLADGTTTYLRKATSLGEIPEGQALLCRITLNSQLGTLYATPEDMEFTVGADQNTCTIKLVPFRSIALSGTVVDGDGAALSGASVSVNQTLNGKFSKSYTAKTDRQGQWSLSVLDAPETRLTYAATECVNVNDTIGAFEPEVSTLDLGKTMLKSIVGARVTYSFTYHAAGVEEVEDYYSDYQNVIVNVFNVTQKRAHNEVSLQYPIIAVLDENINVGDELRLIATSKTGAFNPIEKTVIVGENQRAEVTFDIVGKGGIAASFEMTDNPAVIAMLYSSKGELLKKQTYAEAQTTFTELEDGDYTLVTMGQSDLMNSILRLSNFSEIGLTEGKDYVMNTVKVESGKLAEVKNSEIPAFDESLFYYTNSSTSFSANKSSITTGNYLTLRSAIDFKGVYKNDISNVALVVDLPEACDFVEKSVIQGPNLLPYTLDNNRLTVQLGNNYMSQVRFCVIPTTGGSFNATASIVFDYNGKTLTQPIGSAISEIKDIEITVPSVVAGAKFKVAGTALGKSEVKVIEDGTVLGSGKANAAGFWNVECELNNPYNLSTHQIYAEITTPEGTTLITETKGLTYDVNALRVSKVTMFHDNPEMGKTYEITFDFINPNSEPQKYIYYIYNKKFTFSIEFTTSDPETLTNVVLWVKTGQGKQIPLDAFYDEKQKCWIAMGEFGNMYDGDIPVNVSVDFDALVYGPISRTSMTEAKFDYADYAQEVETITDEVEALISSASSLSTEEFEVAFTAMFGTSVNTSTPDIKDLPIDELLNNADLLLAQSQAFLDEENVNNGWKQFLTQTELGTIDLSPYGLDGTIITEEIGNITPEQLAESGFSKISIDDNSDVYELITDTKYVVADFKSNTYTTFTYNDNEYVSRVNRASNYNSNDIQILIDQTLLFEGKVSDLVNLVSNINTAVSKIPDFFKNRIWDIDALIATNRDTYQALRQSITSDMPDEQVSKITEKVEKLIQDNCRLGQEKRLLNATVKRLETAISKITYAVSALCNAYTMGNNLREYINLWFDVPYCGCIPERTAELQRLILNSGLRCATKDIANIVGDMVLLNITINSAFLAPATGGQSLIVTAASIGLSVLKVLANEWSNKEFAKERARYRSQVIALGKDESCKKCPDPEPEPTKPPRPTNPTNPKPRGNDGGGEHKSGNPDNDPSIDPSGYVYEAIPENRVEGVQATIYYKETKEDMYGDPYEEVVLWNAEEYAQRNPLFTDENGMYRWDVPQGLWQVKFEKDGYVTAYSEWLPVPPPQLDVNIGIVQNKQPEVIEARAYEEGVEVQFDKFMDLSTLTTDNIYVTANGEKLSGEIRLIDSALADEYADEEDANATRYASRVRFVPTEPLSVTTGEIRVTVSRNVLSYAGIPMTETFSQVLDVEKEVQIIAADDVKVLYGGEKEVTVYALPYEAAVGRTLRIANSSELITSIDKTEATIDEEGKATVIVKGDLPGRAQLTFTIDDVTVTGECAVDVVTEIINAEAPKSSRASGTAVYRGTKVELTTESKDGVIYFTTDGSCPCDENGTRRKYTVPIIINEDTKILAMTTVGTGDDDVSETVEFNYTLKRSDMDFAMDEGWTWISHNFEAPIAAETLAADENVHRIMSQTQEVIRDPQLGLVGTLQELNASESYKVETTSATARQRLSEIAWNPATPISINAGWNWLGYPVGQTMSVDEAFAPTDAENLDVIVGQNGFAQFDGEKWVGTLETLSPGLGYMYQSRSPKDVVYNTSIVSTASARYAVGISENTPLVLDIHKYPSVMPVVATIKDVDGMTMDNEDYQVNAFCGTECRGIGRVVNGLVMMNVYGNAGDRITIQVTDKEGSVQFANDSSLSFSENIVGNLNDPYAILINDYNGISDVAYDGNIKVGIVGEMLVIKGIAADDIELVEVYDIDGHKLIHETKVAESGIKVSHLNAGVYVVIVNGNGEYTYHKLALR